jgi:hypothetical protein
MSKYIAEPALRKMNVKHTAQLVVENKGTRINQARLKAVASNLKRDEWLNEGKFLS